MVRKDVFKAVVLFATPYSQIECMLAVPDTQREETDSAVLGGGGLELK
jgi:hypothetical protein